MTRRQALTLPLTPLQCLQALNPIPFAATFANTAAWMAYSFLIVDYFVFAPNVVGVPAGLFNTMICYSLAPRKVSRRHAWHISTKTALAWGFTCAV